ncbi:MAG: 3-deoxy-manno-octulosonate cytidylyltransferase [Gemmatimonadota bacterium]|nr:3-deoxy-manno-octulosonate cytidylyltransferase [Gemmatimonadota bacterium]
MRSLAVIPARLGATRLPRKPLRLLAGAPLVVRVWQRVSDLDLADRVIVATDSAEVADAVAAAGAECVMTRADHASGTDRVAEVASRPEHAGVDVIVNVQGDEPFVSADAIRGATEMVSSGAFSLGTAAARISPTALASSNVVKVVRADDGRAMYFSRAEIPYLRDPADATERSCVARQHIGVYAYTPDALAAWIALPVHPLERAERLEQLRPLAAGMAMGVALVDASPEPGIDTEEDLVNANARWTDFIGGRT